MPAYRDRILDDDTVISTTAALVALGGHALIVLAALVFLNRPQTTAVVPQVVGLTLVSAVPGDVGASPSAARVQTPTAVTASNPSIESVSSSGAGLDALWEQASSETPTTGQAGSGSSRADYGLGKGEGAQGIDLYAAASLPAVGARPTPAPTGTLWQRVAPCWRTAAAKAATLRVDLADDGGLAGAPQAVRVRGARVDAQMLLAERAAARAVEACAPYPGLGAKQWRVAFP